MDRSRPQGNRTAERGEYPRMQTGEMQGGPSQTYRDRRMGDVRKAQRRRQIAKTYNRYVMRLAIVLGLVLTLVVAGVVVFNSALFTIENVQVSGTDYLTAADVVAIADIPDGMTLQRLDKNAIVNNLTSNPWIESAEVTRTLPNTIEIKVTERTIAAVVQIPMTEVNATVTKWAIASDGVWLAQVDESLVSGAGTTTTATTTTTTTDAAAAASATASVATTSTTDVTTDTTTTDETVTDDTAYDQTTTDETAYADDGTTDNTDYTGDAGDTGGDDQVTYDADGNIVPTSVDIADGGGNAGSSDVAAGSSNIIVIGASSVAIDASRASSGLQGLGIAAAEETVDTTNTDAATVTGSTATGSTTTTPVTGSATTTGTTGSASAGGAATSGSTSESVSVSSTSQVLDVTAANEDIARRVAEDSASLPLVTDVSTDVLPEAGKRCTDEGVLNALSIISTLSSDLLRQISSISAASAEKTTFTLNNGVIVAFGSSEDAQSKERIVLQLLSEHAGTISYINVRVVDRPAWRGIG